MNFSQKQLAAALILTLLVLGSSAKTYAAYHDPLTDAHGTLRELRQHRDDLRSRREARDNLRAARAAVQEAQKNLQEARKAVKASKQYVSQAEGDAALSRKALADATTALRDAQKRMELVAGYQAQIKSQQAIVDQLTAQSHGIIDELKELNRQMDALTEEMNGMNGSGAELSEDRIAAVQRAVEQVGYDQSRLDEAEGLADAYMYGYKDAAAARSAKETRAKEISAEAEQISAQGTDASHQLDAVNAKLAAAASRLSELQSTYGAAEASLRDAVKWQADARKWDEDAENQVKTAKENEAGAELWAKEAGTALVQSQRNLAKTAADVWRLGTGFVSMRTGFLYRHWQGKHTGHQAYMPISFYTAERLDPYPGEPGVDTRGWPAGGRVHSLEVGVDTGRLVSNTGGSVITAGQPDWSSGKSSGWTDTILSLRYHNDNPINSLRYGFAIVAPTGESRYYRDAYVPKGVGLFQDFGGGWQFQPEIEGVHRFTGRDSLTGKLIYTNRHSYNYSKEVPGAEVDPGDQTTVRLAYDHTGDKHQLRTWLSYMYTGSSTEDGIYYSRQGGKYYWQQGSLLHYRDGAALEAGIAANLQLRPKDELGLYATLGHTAATSGDFDVSAMNEGGVLLSLRHEVTPQFSWEGVGSWYRATLGYDPLYQEKTEAGWDRYGLGIRLDWKASQVDRWSLDLERYVRTQKNSSNYNGYGVSFWYTHTF